MVRRTGSHGGGRFRYWTVLRDGDAIGSIDLSHHGRHATPGPALLFRRDNGAGLAREAMAAVDRPRLRAAGV